jgi:hypothetical protein
MPQRDDSFISTPYIPEKVNWDDPRVRHILNTQFKRLSDAVGQMSFLDADGGIGPDKRCLNIDAVWVRYVSNAIANTEDEVPHALGMVPYDIWVGIPDKSAIIYRGTTAWTKTRIYLKASAPTVTVNLIVF